jgi:hypothetical protein
MTGKSERMLIEAAEFALANPGARVLVLGGKTNLVIQSEKALTPFQQECDAKLVQPGGVNFQQFTYEAPNPFEASEEK